MPTETTPIESIRQMLRSLFRGETLRRTIRDWKWILAFTRGHWTGVMVNTLLGISVSTLGLVTGIVSKYLIDCIITLDRDRLLPLAALMILSSVLGLVLQSISSRYSARLGVSMRNDVQRTVFRELLSSQWLHIRQFSTGDLMNRFSADVRGMVIFPLGIKQLSERASFEYTAHLAVELHMGIVFVQHIERLTLFRGADQGNAVCHRRIGGAFAENVYAALKQTDSIRRVLMKVVAEKHRFKSLVLNKIVKCGIYGNVISKHFFCLVGIFFIEIANCNNLGVVGKHALVKRGASVSAEDAHFNCFFRHNIFSFSLFISV